MASSPSSTIRSNSWNTPAASRSLGRVRSPGTPSERVPRGTLWSPSRLIGGPAVAAAEPEHPGRLLEDHAVGHTWAVAAQGMGIRSLGQEGGEPDPQRLEEA